jgi:hypothetical protein
MVNSLTVRTDEIHLTAADPGLAADLYSSPGKVLADKSIKLTEFLNTACLRVSGSQQPLAEGRGVAPDRMLDKLQFILSKGYQSSINAVGGGTRHKPYAQKVSFT